MKNLDTLIKAVNEAGHLVYFSQNKMDGTYYWSANIIDNKDFHNISSYRYASTPHEALAKAFAKIHV